MSERYSPSAVESSSNGACRKPASAAPLPLSHSTITLSPGASVTSGKAHISSAAASSER